MQRIKNKHIVKLSSTNTVTIAPFRKYAGKSALVYVEELCLGSCKVTLLNIDELTGDKTTE